MLKKILPILGVVLLAIFILITSLVKAVSAKSVNSAARLNLAVVVSPTPTVTPTPKIEYFLPYPGILPDSPLYRLKMIRDRIGLIMTVDLLKRTEMQLLYADKRIGAGKVLIEGNQVPLGLSTLTKGIKYLENAINEVQKAKQKGLEVNGLVVRIRTASLKYEEILIGISEKVNPEGKAVVNSMLNSIRDLQEKAKKI